MDDDAPEPRRQVWHFLLLVFVGFLVIGSLALSRRGPALTSFYNVAVMRPVPPGIDAGDENYWGLVVHRSDWNPPVAALLGKDGAGRPPRLGWVVTEWSFLGLPMIAYRIGGPAIVHEDSYGYRLAGLTPEQQDAVDRQGGIGWFPWWRYCWGLLGPFAVAGFAWAELRWQAQRRAILGIL